MPMSVNEAYSADTLQQHTKERYEIYIVSIFGGLKEP